MEISEIISRMKSGVELRRGKYGWFLYGFFKQTPVDEKIIAEMENKGLIKTEIPYISDIATLTEKGLSYGNH